MHLRQIQTCSMNKADGVAVLDKVGKEFPIPIGWLLKCQVIKKLPWLSAAADGGRPIRSLGV
jgi:hypothetical protein